MEPHSNVESPTPPSMIAMRTAIGRTNDMDSDACYSFCAAGQTNEDKSNFAYCVVCSVSGEDAEKHASKLVSELHVQILKRIYLPFIEMSDSANREPISEALQDLFSQIDQENNLLTIALFITNIVYVAHVGDTRVYFVYEDGIEQITVDRSYIQKLIASQEITLPQGKILINARTSQQADHWGADILIRKRNIGNRFVLCTQGLSRLVTVDEIQRVVMSNAPHEAADKLVDLATERDATQSITVMIA